MNEPIKLIDILNITSTHVRVCWEDKKSQQTLYRGKAENAIRLFKDNKYIVVKQYCEHFVVDGEHQAQLVLRVKEGV